MQELQSAIAALANDFECSPPAAMGTARIQVDVGPRSLVVNIDEQQVRVTDAAGEHRVDATVSVDEQSWDRFCSEPPPRGFTTAQAIVASQGVRCVSGDLSVWARYATVVDSVLEALRAHATGPRPSRHSNPDPLRGEKSPIVGGYLTLQLGGKPHRIYYETAGKGIPVLCLHTAGADSRQFRYLLEDDELTQDHQFVAFDMPWHGRSDPPDDWASTRYALDTETYAQTILEFADALELDRPVLMGCSMGGAIALYLAATEGDKFRAVCALEGGLGNPGRFVPWTNHLEVDHSHFLTSWVGGLIAPSSPTGPRNQTLWGYAQSGPGVYQGDTYFYSNDLPKHAGELGPATCPLWVFSGEYDYSATTEMSREAAEKLGGELIEMKGSGHFPMSEDPQVFRSYLSPVLERIRELAQTAKSR